MPSPVPRRPQRKPCERHLDSSGMWSVFGNEGKSAKPEPACKSLFYGNENVQHGWGRRGGHRGQDSSPVRDCLKERSPTDGARTGGNQARGDTGDDHVAGHAGRRCGWRFTDSSNARLCLDFEDTSASNMIPSPDTQGNCGSAGLVISAAGVTSRPVALMREEVASGLYRRGGRRQQDSSAARSLLVQRARAPEESVDEDMHASGVYRRGGRRARDSSLTRSLLAPGSTQRSPSPGGYNGSPSAGSPRRSPSLDYLPVVSDFWCAAQENEKGDAQATPTRERGVDEVARNGPDGHWGTHRTALTRWTSSITRSSTAEEELTRNAVQQASGRRRSPGLRTARSTGSLRHACGPCESSSHGANRCSPNACGMRGPVSSSGDGAARRNLSPCTVTDSDAIKASTSRGPSNGCIPVTIERIAASGACGVPVQLQIRERPPATQVIASTPAVSRVDNPVSTLGGRAPVTVLPSHAPMQLGEETHFTRRVTSPELPSGSRLISPTVAVTPKQSLKSCDFPSGSHSLSRLHAPTPAIYSVSSGDVTYRYQERASVVQAVPIGSSQPVAPKIAITQQAVQPNSK